MEKIVSKLENPQRLEELNPINTLKKAGFQNQMVLCDIGAGTGIFSFSATEITENTVYALEVSDDMISILNNRKNEKGVNNLTIKKVISKDLPIEDHCCDYSLLVTVFHELAKKEDMLFEIKRILKSKGKLVIIEFHQKETPFGPPISHRISEELVQEICSKNGFQLIENTSLGKNFYCSIFEKKL